MSEQTEALRLADELEQSVNNPHLYWQGKAAAVLRRQHERIKELEAQNTALLDVDWLAQVIRVVDGENKLGASALAEQIVAAIEQAEKEVRCD